MQNQNLTTIQASPDILLAEMQSRNAGITGDLIPVAQAESLPQLFGERDENGYAKILGIIENIEKQASSIVFDITTKEGQATCRSLAAKIAKAKTAIDKAGKEKKTNSLSLQSGLTKIEI